VYREAGIENLEIGKEISLMKKGSYLLNASRGVVVDLDALAAALKSGHLAGAAIDVYPSEPSANISNDFSSGNNVLLFWKFISLNYI